QGEALVSAATATVAQGEAVVSAATATVAQGVAMGAAATATVAQGEAEFAAATAVAEATRADQNAVRAQQDQSRLLSNLANQQLTVDPVASLHLSEYALRKEDQPQPYTAEAEFALTQAVRAVLEKTFLRVSQTPFQPGQVAFRPAHDQVAIGGAALQLTDVSLAEPITVAQPAAGRLQIEWLPNGELLGYTNRSVALWNMQGVQLVESTDLGNGVHCAHKLPDASLVIICLPSSFYLWEYDTRLSTSAIVQSVSFTETFQLHDVVAAPNHQILIATSLLSPTLLIRMSGGTMAVTHEMDVTLADLTFVNEHQFIGRDNNGNILLWSIDSAIDGTTLTSSTKYGETNEPAEGFVFLSERQQVMTFLASGSMVLWNLAGERLRTFSGHAARVNEIAWHPDPTSPYFASSSIDGTARIWDVADGKPVMTLYGHTSDLRSNRLDVLGLHWKDVRYLITYGRDGTLREWEVFDEFGQPLCYLTDPDGYPRCYRFSRRIPTTTLQLTSARWLADGQNIVTTDAKGLVGKLTVANKSWITATNLVSATLVPTDPQSAIYPVSLWNPEGTHTFSYFQEDSLPDELINANHNYDGVLHQFEPQIQRPGKIAGPITTAFWWEIGLLVSRKSGDTFLYPDPINKPSYRQRLSGHFGPVTQAKLFAEQRLVTADAQGNVRVYELGAQDNLSPAYTFHLDDEAAGMQSDIISLAWDHTGEQLLIVRSTLDQSTFRFIQTVILWQPVKDKILWQRNVVATNVPLAFSPDNQQIAIAIGPKLETWRADTGEPQWAKRAKDDANPIYGLRWVEGKVWPQQLAEANPATADASRPLILTWNGDGLTQFWDAESGIEVTRLHTNGPTYFVDVYEPADHPAQILTAGYTKEIAIWDAWYRNPAQLLAIAPTLMNRALSPQQQELFGIPMPTATPTPEAVAQQ
ncbi:MAG: WD40 repeat domain-containing protein, partial [Caldilineaceae bacterium]|nr:WD40 repeat domain-containing protein [Caldilineaceae bacterium]